MKTDAITQQSPPVFLQLAGHPLRWQILSQLASSDRFVKELARLVVQPQNLVSYHLGKLRDAGLVFARQSSRDRRDNYYGLDLRRVGDLLMAAGHSLHPALRLTPAGMEAHPIAPARVLFLCTGNSARSQMAEALLRHASGGRVEAFSAGSEPKPIHPNALKVMKALYGMDLTGHTSTHVATLADEPFDRVITLCDRVREKCPAFPGEPAAAHWSIPNPASDADDDQTYPKFVDVAMELKTRIDFLLAVIAAQAN